MAMLINKLKLPSGLEVPSVYCRIEVLTANSSNCESTLNFYMSQSAYRNGLPRIHQERVNFKPDISNQGLNYHKQTYDYMRILPEYENAVDVLEDGQEV